MDLEHIAECPLCGHSGFSDFIQCIDHTVSNKKFSISQCNSCGLRFTNPRPSNNLLETYYESESYVSHSASKKGFINSIYLFVRNFTLKWKVNLVFKQLKRTGSILDYGCGTGEFLNECTMRGFTTAGFEPSEKALKKANTLNINNLYSEIPNKAQFDVITLWHVLEHIPNFKEIIRSLKLHLKEDGFILIAVPNPESYDAKHYQTSWAAYDVPRHLWHFTKPDIQTLVETLGMKLTEVIPMKLDAFYVSLLSEKYKRSNRLGLTGMIAAVRTALRSNHKASSSKNFSSLIYIARP